jgi:hypothetical protein
MFSKIQIKLLQIKTNSFFIYLLLIPPVYAIWLFSICRVISRNKNEKLLVSSAIIIFAILVSMAFFIYPVLLINKSPFLASSLSDALIFAGMNYWILISIVIAFLSIRYEKTVLNIRLTTDMFDYFIRFFVIINWLIGIWSYQKIVNNYVTDVLKVK